MSRPRSRLQSRTDALHRRDDGNTPVPGSRVMENRGRFHERGQRQHSHRIHAQRPWDRSPVPIRNAGLREYHHTAVATRPPQPRDGNPRPLSRTGPATIFTSCPHTTTIEFPLPILIGVRGGLDCKEIIVSPPRSLPQPTEGLPGPQLAAGIHRDGAAKKNGGCRRTAGINPAARGIGGGVVASARLAFEFRQGRILCFLRYQRKGA